MLNKNIIAVVFLLYFSSRNVRTRVERGLSHLLFHLIEMLLPALRVFQLRLPTHFLNSRYGPYRSLSTMGAIGTQTVDTTDRLAALRKHMAEHNVGTYIVPSEDQRKSLDPSDWRSARILLLSRFQRVPRRVR